MVLPLHTTHFLSSGKADVSENMSRMIAVSFANNSVLSLFGTILLHRFHTYTNEIDYWKPRTPLITNFVSN